MMGLGVPGIKAVTSNMAHKFPRALVGAGVILVAVIRGMAQHRHALTEDMDPLGMDGYTAAGMPACRCYGDWELNADLPD